MRPADDWYLELDDGIQMLHRMCGGTVMVVPLTTERSGYYRAKCGHRWAPQPTGQDAGASEPDIASS